MEEGEETATAHPRALRAGDLEGREKSLEVIFPQVLQPCERGERVSSPRRGLAQVPLPVVGRDSGPQPISDSQLELLVVV